MKLYFLIVFTTCLFGLFSQTPIFYGGDGNGAITNCYSQSYYLGIEIFSGSINDGHSNICIEQIGANEVFSGGKNDGATSLCFEQDLIIIFGLFTGGKNDGSDVSCYLQSNNSNSNIFYGNSNDGFAMTCFEQNENIANSTLFVGGISDGFSVNCYSQQEAVGADIYKGADGDGFDVLCYEEDLALFFNRFTGGDGDGDANDCFLEESYLVSLPVELVSFDAVQVGSERRIQIFWETASEQNNDYFEVERSKNGLDWEVFVKKDGAGTSFNTINYIEYDNTPYSGISYYRLKQVDFDGESSYSKVKSVDLNSNVALINELLIYPNPATDLLNFQFGNFETNDLKVYIFGMNGKMIREVSVELENGQGLYTVNDIYDIPKGTYLVVVSCGNSIKVKQKIVVN